MEISLLCIRADIDNWTVSTDEYRDKTEMRVDAYSTLDLYNSLVFKIYQQDFDIPIFGKASYITSNSTTSN